MAKNEDLGRIVGGCQAGNAECFSELVDLYGGRCYGYFYRLTGIFKIASNIFHDYLRGKQRRKRLLDTRRQDITGKVIEEKRSESDRADRLQVHLAKLDEGTRELIMLRFYSQMSLKEIAKVRSEPIGTTLSRLHRGLKRLRDMMTREAG
ncbi:MAG: RNA polymerase sigma factor [Planctomycetota bacterium]|jgi:RNA polymerase sigma-70 factor (ECF subfamily)